MTTNIIQETQFIISKYYAFDTTMIVDFGSVARPAATAARRSVGLERSPSRRRTASVCTSEHPAWPSADLIDGPQGKAWALLELVPRMTRWAEIQAIRARPEGEISLRQPSILNALSSGQVSRSKASAAEPAGWCRVRPTVMIRMTGLNDRATSRETLIPSIAVVRISG